jgi:hypothetical protein
MKNAFLFTAFALAIFCSCKRNQPISEGDAELPAQNVAPVIDTKSDAPTSDLVALAKVLDSLGYSSDTLRVKKLKNYEELLNSEIHMIGKFPFYKLDKGKTKILWWNTLATEKVDSIDSEIFQRAENIWAYFYRGKNKDLTTDGVIEEWRFSDGQEAMRAIAKLKSFYPLPYFNTQPYYTAIGRYLYVFHCRASAFSYTQKTIFDKFRKMTLLSNSQGQTLPRN